MGNCSDEKENILGVPKYRNPLLIEQGRVFLEGLEGILARIKPSDPNLNLWLQLIYKTDIKLLSSSSVSNTYIGINWQAN